MLLLLGDASLTFVPDLVVDMDDRDRAFDDGQLDVVRFFQSTTNSMSYWGIFPFRMRFTDLHGVSCSSPFARCTPRRGRVLYFIMIPQWSLS